MKKINLNIKREIKPSKPLEVTHANLDKKEKEKEVKKGKILVSNKSKSNKRKSYILSIRVNENEINKLNTYLEENNTNFSSLVKNLLKENGII